MQTNTVQKFDILLEGKETSLHTSWTLDIDEVQVKATYGYTEYISDPFVFKCRDPTDIDIIKKWINSPCTTTTITMDHKLDYISIDLDNEYAGTNVFTLKGQPVNSDSLTKICLEKVEKLELLCPDPHEHYFAYADGKWYFSSTELENYINLVIQKMAPKEFTSAQTCVWNSINKSVHVYSISNGASASGGLSNYLDCKSFAKMCEIYVYIDMKRSGSSYKRVQILAPTLLLKIMNNCENYMTYMKDNVHYEITNYVNYAGECIVKEEDGTVARCFEQYDHFKSVDNFWCIIRFKKIKLYTEEEVIQSIKSGKPLKIRGTYMKQWY